MRYIAFLVTMLFFAQAEAVVLTIKDCDATRIVVTNQGGGTDCEARPDLCGDIAFDSLRPGSGALKAQDLEDRLNAYITRRDALASDIDPEDPTQVSNPAATFGEKFFWCDADRAPLAFGVARDGNTFLCSRADVVEVADLPDGVSCPITIRRARDCAADPSFVGCAP